MRVLLALRVPPSVLRVASEACAIKRLPRGALFAAVVRKRACDFLAHFTAVSSYRTRSQPTTLLPGAILGCVLKYQGMGRAIFVQTTLDRS